MKLSPQYDAPDFFRLEERLDAPWVDRGRGDLSFRVPFAEPVAGEHQWLLDGQARVFDRTG